MALLVGYPGGYSQGNTATVDLTQQNPLFTRGFDVSGNEYIYLGGATTVDAANWVVSYVPSTGIPTLIAADAVGPVAVSMAAVNLATSFGWYQIWGFGSAKSDTVAGVAQLFIDGTAGRVDDAIVTGDLIVGMTATAADTTNVVPVQLRYPYISNALG